MDIAIALKLARTLMAAHKLNDWRFYFDNAKRRAGCCRYRRRAITLSRYYTTHNSEEEVRDTLLHEIAHALAGAGNGHNALWKSICVKIGAKPVRCYDAAKVVMPKPKYKAICGGCKTEFFRHRRKKMATYCARCGPDVGLLNYT